MPIVHATMKAQGNMVRQSTPEQLSKVHDMSCTRLELTCALYCASCYQDGNLQEWKKLTSAPFIYTNNCCNITNRE